MTSLDEEKLELIRSWGVGLEADDRDEVRAAGRAILMLAEEVERLNVELWNARAVARASDAVDGSGPEEPLEEAPEVLGALRSRLAHRLRLGTGH